MGKIALRKNQFSNNGSEGLMGKSTSIKELKYHSNCFKLIIDKIAIKITIRLSYINIIERNLESVSN